MFNESSHFHGTAHPSAKTSDKDSSPWWTSTSLKIFDRKPIKLSYSCMRNIKQIINSHNKRILNSHNRTTTTTTTTTLEILTRTWNRVTADIKTQAHSTETVYCNPSFTKPPLHAQTLTQTLFFLWLAIIMLINCTWFSKWFRYILLPYD